MRRVISPFPHNVTVFGTIFKIDSLNIFSVIHTFTAGEGSGSPGGLTLASDGDLYGTTTGGPGHIFRVSPFETLHTFVLPEGSNPYAGLLQASNGDFYGTTLSGGAGGVGTIFKMDSSNSLTALHSFPTEGQLPRASLMRAKDGAFYGMTQQGGASGVGTAFKTNSSGAITTLHSFNGADGATPLAALIQAADGKFYGTTSGGGTGGYGTVFKMDSTGDVTPLHSFDQTDGVSPTGALIQAADGKFYGTTSGGGTGGFGTVFRMDSTGDVTPLHSFDNADGASPSGALIQAADGKFYGTTSGGGTGGFGTVFKMDSTGNVTTLHSFDNSDGAYPFAALIQAADGKFYGTTQNGGAGNFGTVFRISSTGDFATLHDFNGIDGSTPTGTLIQTADGNFYGTTRLGGAFGDTGFAGTIFKIDPSGNLATLHSFRGADGADLYCALALVADGILWGTTSGGGLAGAGTVFRLILGAASFSVTSISPKSGSSSGGMPVGIAGTGFQAGARVTIGDSPANAVSVGSASAVSALAPTLLPGTLNAVTVVNLNASFGTASNLWFADFLDVPQADDFHAYVETIFRKGITAGYGNGEYGRDNPGDAGADGGLPAQGRARVRPTCLRRARALFPTCRATSPFAAWIEQLAAEGVTAGCGGGLYCPDQFATRRQMAVFLLKAKQGSGYTPPAATGIFGDVPQADPYAPWIEELYHRQISGGCQASPPLYCPDNPTVRGQLAVFLVKTFGM